MQRLKLWIPILPFILLSLCASAWAQKPDFIYQETDLLPGASMIDKLRHVSQRDLLDNTKADLVRCSSAAILNAYLLLGGDWAAVAQRLHVGQALTFENIHRAQEALYLVADHDGKPGVFGGSLPEWDEKTGAYRGWKPKPTDEAHHIYDFLYMEHFPLYGPTKERITSKRAAIERALGEHPATVLIVGVDEHFEEAISRPTKPGSAANHYTLVFARQGKFYILDPWAKIGHYALREFSAADTQAMLYDTGNPIYAVRLKQR
jgi:hypothetical protein